MGPDRLALLVLAGTAGIGLALVEALPSADFVLQVGGFGMFTQLVSLVP